MSRVRYVCLSDLHLGEEDSLLTNLKAGRSEHDPSSPSPVLEKLCECLRTLAPADGGPRPTLILAGDILELALATMDEAAMCFERFVELAMPAGGELFDRIVYVPGNHDHHVWEIARETQYVGHIDRKAPGDLLDRPWHTTRMFPGGSAPPVTGYFLGHLVHRYEHLESFDIEVAYPNLGLIHPKTRRCAVFHHGHFVERLYHLMSDLSSLLFPDRSPPSQIWDVEAENFAWIDFFWSAMGRSGRVGPLVQKVYNSLGHEGARDRLVSSLAASLADRYDLPGVGDWMEERILGLMLKALSDWIASRERSDTSGAALTEEGEAGLAAYLEGPLRNQMLGELGGRAPSEVTFVFGHTHRPFEGVRAPGGFPGEVAVYNTGGWVVETPDPEPVHGASAVLLDEDLDAVALRLYDETYDPSGTPVRVARARPSDGSPSPLAEEVGRVLDESRPAWDGLSRAIAEAVRVRAGHLRRRLEAS